MDMQELMKFHDGSEESARLLQDLVARLNEEGVPQQKQPVGQFAWLEEMAERGRAAAKIREEKIAAFVPSFEQCGIHGRWQSSMIDEQGIVKHRQNCPECARIEKEGKEQRGKFQAILRDSGLPKRFWNRDLSNYEAKTPQQAKVLRFCVSYADGFDTNAAKTGQSVIFCGNPGNGKTHLACGIGIELAKKGLSVGYVEVGEILSTIRATWTKKDGLTEREVIGVYRDYDLLIIDEVGVQYGTDSEKIHLYDVINARYKEVKPTIVISNLEIEGIKTFLGERVVDRLREADGKAFPFNWESYRSANRAN